MSCNYICAGNCVNMCSSCRNVIAQGPRGFQGFQGPTGPTGPTGATGATGASGITLANAYGSFVSNTQQTVANGSEIALAVNNASSNITPNAGNTGFTVNVTAPYKISYGVISSSVTGNFALAVDGAEVPNSELAITQANQERSNDIILNLTSGNVVGITNTGVGSFTLPADSVNAFLTLNRLI